MTLSYGCPVLRELERYPVAVLVPGHGPVMSDHRFTTLVRETFELVHAQADASYRARYPLHPTVARVDIREQRPKFVRSDGTTISESTWEAFTRSVAQHLAECYHGYRC
jgi:hypothetical protein